MTEAQMPENQGLTKINGFGGFICRILGVKWI
jgi:hypothetical protein